MLEREMENLIADNPEHFFPRHGFVLKGRQQSFKGVGRFDLLFEDRHGVPIFMELKAVPARYEVIDQVARYRDALKALGSTNVIMLIVSPSIPPGMKEFLSHLGIEYTEIHETEFKRIATVTGYAMRDSTSERHIALAPCEQSRAAASIMHKIVSAPPQRSRRSMGFHGDIDDWGFGKGTQPAFLIRALENGDKTKEHIRSEYIAHFHPDLPYARARSISGFGVFFSDCKRPVRTYHASRSLIVQEEKNGLLTLDEGRSRKVRAAVAAGILHKLRGLHFQRDKPLFNRVLADFGIPYEP